MFSNFFFDIILLLWRPDPFHYQRIPPSSSELGTTHNKARDALATGTKSIRVLNESCTSFAIAVLARAI